MAFELQPILKGELIELRPLAPEDWDELFAVASDSLIWEQHPEPDRYKEGVLERDETFSVAGRANWVETRQFKFNLPGQKVLVVTPTDNAPVYLSDDMDLME